MSLPDYVRRLRQKVGSELLMLPCVMGLVCNQAGDFLLIQHSDTGKWGFPAGLIEPGETPVEAIQREIREETGLEIEPERLIGVLGGQAYRHTYPNGDVVEPLAVVFACRILAGQLQKQSVSESKIKRLQFFTQAQLPDLNLPYPDWIYHSNSPGFD